MAARVPAEGEGMELRRGSAAWERAADATTRAWAFACCNLTPASVDFERKQRARARIADLWASFHAWREQFSPERRPPATVNGSRAELARRVRTLGLARRHRSNGMVWYNGIGLKGGWTADPHPDNWNHSV